MIIAGVVLGQPITEIIVLVALTLALAGLVVVRHRSNIQRLREGTEGKVAWARR
jgi:glycerol-3-phosphate acyltransferase PlsY